MVASTYLPHVSRIAILLPLLRVCLLSSFLLSGFLLTGCQPLEKRLRGTSDLQATPSQETSAAPSPEVVSAGWWNPFQPKAKSTVERQEAPAKSTSGSLSNQSLAKPNPLQRFQRFMGVTTGESPEPSSAEAKITDSNIPRATMQENLDAMDQRLLAALRQPATRPGFRNTAAAATSSQVTDPAIPGGETKPTSSEAKQSKEAPGLGESLGSRPASSDPVAPSAPSPLMAPPGLPVPSNPIASSKVEPSALSTSSAARTTRPEGALTASSLSPAIAAPEIPSNESPISGLVGSSNAGTSLAGGVQTKPWMSPPAMLPVAGQPSGILDRTTAPNASEATAGSSLKTPPHAALPPSSEATEGVASVVASSLDPSPNACLTRAIQLLESQPETANAVKNRESLERLRQTLASTDPGYTGRLSSLDRDQVLEIVEKWSKESEAGQAGSASHQASADRLLAALARQESGDGMKIGKIEFCNEVFGYGAIEKVASRTFSADQGVLLYLELRNLREAAHEGGFQRKLTGRYELRDDAGQVVAGQDLPEDTESYESSRHDHFIVYRIYMPKKIAAGSYTRHATIEDGLHQRTAEGSIRLKISEGSEKR